MEWIEQQIQKFNQAQTGAPLALSSLELYDMAKQELNDILMAIRLKHFVTKTNKEAEQALTEKIFPEGFIKTLKIKKVQAIENITASSSQNDGRLSQDQQEKFIENIEKNPILSDSHGVTPVYLNFEKSAHLIYLRCQNEKNKKSVFR